MCIAEKEIQIKTTENILNKITEENLQNPGKDKPIQVQEKGKQNTK